MTCKNPVLLREFHMRVPCGKCAACRIARSREWAVRMVHEASTHEENVFLTLTYNNDNLPSDNSLSKRDFQLFMKRLRKNIECLRIKYYACGEYGEQTGRPHYHAIVFGLGMSYRELIQEVWPHGFVYVGTVTYDSARYVADYIQKKYSGLLAQEVYGNRERPFQLQSKGIGQSYMEENQKQILQQLKCTINGVNHGLPRYYKKKLGIDAEMLLSSVEDRKSSIRAHYERLNDEDVYPAIQKSRKQSDRNIKARMSLRRKKI